MEFKIIMDIDKIKVYSPYNPEFVRRIKHMKGKEQLLKRIAEIDELLQK